MLLYWIWFAQLKGIPVWLKIALLQHFHDPEEIYFSNRETLSQLEDVPPAHLEVLEDKNLEEAEGILTKCRRKGIQILTIGDDTYPQMLKSIPDPPVVLYYRGTLPDWEMQPAIGVVGTRKATPYGLQAAYQMGTQIAQCGGLVVSGAASGIDTKAMQGALDAGKIVVGVLGCGADVIYPHTNRKLYAQTIENGCLLTEYAPGEKPLGWHFPQRNRIISGISHGILVVEAPKKSGALSTARHAKEQGRDVFAVPANMGIANFEGSNTLLEEGAVAALSGWRIVREYAGLFPETVCEPGTIPVQNREEKVQKVAQEPIIPEKCEKKVIDNPEITTYSVLDNKPAELNEEEKAILALISRTPQHPDEVAARSDMSAGKVQSIITRLTIKGFLMPHSGGRVSIK